MSVRTLKSEKGLPYFCTITNKSWIPLFEMCQFHDAIYRWFELLKSNGNDVLAYVIMPNHLHWILHVDHEGQSLDRLIGEAKRLMSYSLVARLKKSGRTETLDTLAEMVSSYERSKGIKHKLFEDSFDGKAIYTDKFLEQKLIYIHENPWRKEMVRKPEEYQHSSARFYKTGIHAGYAVTHYVEKYYGKEEYEFNRKFWWGEQ